MAANGITQSCVAGGRQRGRRLALAGCLLATTTVASSVLSSPERLALAQNADVPSLTVALTAPSQLDVGEPGEFSVTVTNLGGDVTDVVMNLSEGFGSATTITVTDAAGWLCDSAVFGVECTRSSIAAGSSPMVITGTITATSNSGPEIVMIAELTVTGTGFSTSDETTIAVRAVTDLEVTALLTPIAALGDTYSVSIDVANVGAELADFPGPVELVVDAWVFGGSSVADANITLTGEGWSCVGSMCQHSGPVPAGMGLPSLLASGVFEEATEIYVELQHADDNFSNDWAYVEVVPELANLAVLRGGISASPAPGAPTGVGFDVWNQYSTVQYAGAVTLAITSGLAVPSASGPGWTCAPFVAGSTTCTTNATGSQYLLPRLTVTGVTPLSGSTIVTTATVAPGGWRASDDSVTWTQPVAAAAGVLQVDLSSSLTELTPGGPFDATAVVSNVGLGSYTQQIGLVFAMPAGVTVSGGAGWTCSTLGCSHAGPIAAGAALPPIVFTSAAILNAPTTLSVTAGPFPSGFPTVSDTLQLPATRADMTLAIAPSAPEFDAGAPASFSYDVSNVGDGTMYGEVSLTLSADLVDQLIAGDGWTCDPSGFGSTSCSASGPLPAGGSLPTLTLSGTAIDDWDLEANAFGRVAFAFDGSYANDAASVAVPVNPLIDLTLAGTVTPSPLRVGEQASFELMLTNVGVGTAESDVSVSIDSSAFDIEAAAGVGWSCNVEWYGTDCTYLSPLGPGAVAPTLSATGRVRTMYSGTAASWASSRHPDDRRYQNGDVRIDHVVVAPVDLAIAVTPGTPGFTIGTPGTYTATVTNLGDTPSDGMIEVELSSQWNDVEVTGASGDGWDCSFTRVCTTSAAAAAGGSLPTIAFDVLPVGTEDGETTTWAYVRGGGDGRTDNSTLYVTTPVTVTSDVMVNIAADRQPLLVGEQNGYTVTVSHVGPSALAGPLTATIDLDRAFDNGSGSGDGWACTSPWGYRVVCEYAAGVPAGGVLPPLAVVGDLSDPFWNAVDADVWISIADGDQRRDNSRATVTTPVAGTSDLAIAVAGEGTAIGEPLSVTATVSNVLATDAIGTVTVRFWVDPVTDPLAAGEGWTCAAPARSQLACTHPGPVLAEGSLPPVTMTGTARPTYLGTASVSAQVDAAADANDANDYDSAAVELSAPVDLVLDVSDADATFTAGVPGRIDVAVTNLGTQASTGDVVVSGNVSPRQELAWSGDGWACSVQAFSLTCTHPGPVPPGGDLSTLALDVIATPGSSNLWTSLTVTNASDGRTGNNVDSETTPISNVVDLVVDITDGGAAFAAGGTGSYTVTVANDGSAPSAGAIEVELSLAGPGAITAATGDGWTCDVGTATTCATDALLAFGGELPTITSEVTVTTSGGTELTAYAAVSGGGDALGSGNFDVETTPVLSPDLVVDVSDAGGAFVAPGTGEYLVVVGNRGGSAAVGTVTVALETGGPAMVTGASGSGWTCAVAMCTRTDALDVAADYPPITVDVDVVVTDVRTVSLTATAAGFDANLANSTDTESTPVEVPADLALAISPAHPWVVGRAGAATITVENVGTGASTGPVTVDASPADAGSGAGWTCTPAGTGVSCQHAAGVPVGAALADLTIEYTAALAERPAIELAASVADPSDGTPGNDATSVEVPVLLSVDLAVTAVTPEGFQVGGPGAAEFTVTNLGVESAAGPIGVIVAHPGDAFAALAGDGWSCLELFGIHTCTHPGPVPAGGSLPMLTDRFDVLLGDYPATRFSAVTDHPDDPNPLNDRADVAVPTLGVDLVIDLTDRAGDTPAEIGDTRVFDIAVTSIGGLAPPGSAVVTIDPGPGMLLPATSGAGWACQPDGGVLRCSTTSGVPPTGDLPPLVFETIIGGDGFPATELDVSVVAPAESAVDSANVDAHSFAVTGAPDHVLVIETAEQAVVGARLEAMIVVSNHGQIDAEGVTTVDLAIPAGTDEAIGAGPDWQCGLVEDDTILRCVTTTVVAPAASFPPIAVSLNVLAQAYPRITLDIAVDNPNDGDPLNNAARAGADVIGIPVLVPQLSVVAPFVAGRGGSLELRVGNIGTEPAAAATTVTIDPADADLGLHLTSAGGDGWGCAAVGGVTTCVHPDTVAAGGQLPPLVLNYLPDETRYDSGAPCRPIEYGDRLLRACRHYAPPLSYGVTVDVANPADPLHPDQPAGSVLAVAQPIDVTASTSVADLYVGNLATLTTTVRNDGVDPAPGPVVLTQRIGCGLLPDLASGEQGSCLPGTDVIDVTLTEVRAGEWTCVVAGEVVTCTHPGPIPARAALAPVAIDAEIGLGLRGANLWIAPGVTASGDTNTYNDQPEDGRVITLRPTRDLAVQFVSSDFTVGTNALLGVSVANVSIDRVAGPTVVSVDMPPELDYLDVLGDVWDCTDGDPLTCTYPGAIDAGEQAGLALIVAPVSTGATSTTVGATLANPLDTVARNNTATARNRVHEFPAPLPVLGVAPAIAKVNATVTFDATFSERTNLSTLYRWDFGDGVTAFGETTTHEYQRPGVYTAVLRLTNGDRTERATARVIVTPDEPLVADAGDDRVAEEQLIVALDGGASLPFFAIESYTWDFGDGGTAVGRSVQHIYTAPGTYTATLTIRSGAETATDTVAVEVLEQGAGATGGLQVTVVDASGAPVRAADVAVLDADGVRHSARTDDSGVASLVGLPDGRYAVYAYKLGFKPVIGRARVLGGLGTAGVTLQPGEVGTASLESRRLTLEEIIAAGIDVDDPANQNVLEFEIRLGFSVDPTTPDIGGGFSFLLNGDGEFIDIPISWLCDETLTSCTSEDGSITVEAEEVEDQPVVTVLVIPVKASWLKEFFEVTMLVANLAPKGFAFTDGAATLDIPNGLTLAPTSDPQSLTVELADIPSGKTGTARWIVRGDRAGEYDIGAAYTAVLDPVGAPILLQARTKDPLKVWGTDAVNPRVRAQQQVRKGKPYLVRLGVENISDWPVYNFAFDLGDLAGDAAMEYAPWTERRLTVDVVDPLETVWFDIWLIPSFNGELVSCNLCARGPGALRSMRSAPGASALAAAEPTDAGVFDSSDLTSAVDGLAAGASVSPDPSQTEIVPIADTALPFTAVTDAGADHLAWAPVAGAAGYEVYADGGTTPLAVLDATATSAEVPSRAVEYVLATLDADGRRVLAHAVAVAGQQPLPPPVVTPDAPVAIVGESTTIDLLGNDLDPSGGELSVVGVVQPAHGSVECSGQGVCTYTPDPGFEGTDTFEVVIAGSNGVEVTQVVTVVVAPPGTNRPPSAVTDIASVERDGTVAIDVLTNDADPDGDHLAVSGHSAAAHGTVACGVSACSYVAGAGHVGSDSFTYTVADDGGGTAQAFVQVTVTEPATTTTSTSTSTTTTTTTSSTSSMSSTSTTSTSSTTIAVPTTSATTLPTSSAPTTTTIASGITLPPVPPGPPPFTGAVPGAPRAAARGEVVTITLPNGTQRYRVVIYSTPTVLAEGGAASQTSVTLPATLTPGEHTLVLWTIVNGEVRTYGSVISIADQPVSSLPRTGGTAGPPVSAALLLIATGTALVLITRRTRRGEVS